MMNAPPLVKANAAAALLLVIAALFATYRWNYAPKAQAIAALASLTDRLRLAPQDRALPAHRAVRDGATMPELLSRLQEIASGYGVAIHSVTPSPLNADQIALGMDGDFRGLMLFLGRVETLRVSIDGFELAPSENSGAADGKISATVNLLHSPKTGVPESYADYMDAIVDYTAVRDPFTIGDPVPLPNAGSDLGDISWTYHLTSISLVGAVRTATIDGRDYRIGDHFNGMAVTAIGPSSVSLAAPGKAVPQTLHFRSNPQRLSDGK